MNFPNIRNNNLSHYLDKEELIQEVVAQIKKDFWMFNLEITFSGNVDNAYQDLHQQLIILISRCLDVDSNRLMSVLYQVDVSEEDLAKTAQELPQYNDVEVVAHQVLFRELKKVLFRRYYRGLDIKE